MKKRTRRSWSVGFVSLGCAKNLVDSEVMATCLRRSGIPLAASPDSADVVLVNTCAFVRDAKRESIDAILAACRARRVGRCAAVIVAGCLPQRYGAALAAEIPEVDAFLGVDNIRSVAAVVRALRAGAGRIVRVRPGPRAAIEPPAGRVLFTSGPFAYLKVSEGCDHACTFCAIPSIRGKLRSRPIAAVVREAEDLLARGVLELNLIAQDVTSYGLDLAGRPLLPELLETMGRIGGRFWIRLLYGHPAHVTPRLLDAMAAVPQVCRYLDIPIQHCDSTLLKAMGRPGSAKSLSRLVRDIRARLPGVALRTTCLVGFPGETERRFKTLLDFVRRARFDHLGVFAYSPEDGTSAAGLPDRPSGREARRRRIELLAAQREVIDRLAARRIGRVEEVLIERRSGLFWLARSAREAPEVDGWVRVRTVAGLAPAQFVRVRISGQRGCDMLAEPD